MSKKSVAHLDKVETVPVTMMTCGNGRLQRQVGGHDDDDNNNMLPLSPIGKDTRSTDTAITTNGGQQ